MTSNALVKRRKLDGRDTPRFAAAADDYFEGEHLGGDMMLAHAVEGRHGYWDGGDRKGRKQMITR